MMTREEVAKVLDAQIRPMLHMDGGDIELLDVRDNKVFVRLTGACGGCPSATMTLRMGVERVLRQEFPEQHLREAWGPDFDTRLRDSARARAISRYRSQFPVTKDEWLAGVRSADTGPTT